MADKELWEIELDLKTDKVNAAQKKYNESLEKIKTDERRLTEALKNEGKIQTSLKLNELKLQEANTKAQLLKEITENKTANAKELLDYKQMIAEKNNARRQADQQLKTQQKLDSKFTGQSVELGSVTAITQQIAHFKNLRDNVNRNSKDFAIYSQKVKELNLEKKLLTGTTSGLTTAIGGYGAKLLSVVAIQQAFNLSTQSSKFQVMRDAFTGGEKDLEGFRKATANTVSDGNLLAISNQMSDLNISIKDQTILLAFAESQADKYGTSTEEGFSKVLAIMQGSTKGLKDLGITKTEFTKLTEKLAQTQGVEVDENIRLQAIIQLTNTTYEDAINKSMDLADIHETVSVQVKNVADEHANFWDILSSMNPVVGFFNVGMEDMAKKESKAKDDAMLLIGELDAFNSQIPVWGAGTQELRDYFINLAESFLTTANTAGMISEALGGTSINRKGGDASIPLLGESKNKIKRTGTGSKSSTTKEQTEQLNLIKLQEAELDKLKTKLAANLGDIGAEREIRREILDIEREIFRLRYGADITMKNLPEARGIDIPQTNLQFRKGFKLSSINAGDPRGDMTSDEVKAMLDEQLNAEMQKLNYAIQIQDKFLSMLQTTGLIDDEFFRILSTIKSFISDGFDLFDAITGLAGIAAAPFTGGTSLVATAGVIGGGGGAAGLPNYGSQNGSPLVAPVNIINPISLGRSLEIQNRYDTTRGGIDV